MTIKIFTSLPPGMNRFDASGNNIGMAHYRSCLQSWQDHGFEIVSINSHVEPKSPFEDEFGITRINLDRDAKEICGKPLVYFADFIKTIYENSDGPIIITNADIEFDFSDLDINILTTLKPGHFICEARFDYQHEHIKNSSRYVGGFDFFAIHKNDLPKLFDCHLVFGMPWWDHFLPISLSAQNLFQLRLSENSKIFHLNHSERWDLKNYINFGHIFISELKAIKKLNSYSTDFNFFVSFLEFIERTRLYIPIAIKENFARLILRRPLKNSFFSFLNWVAVANLIFVNSAKEWHLYRASFIRYFLRLYP